MSEFSNPHLSWTYTDEDFMGLIKAVAEACAADTPSDSLVIKLCIRYHEGMAFRMLLLAP